MTPLRETLEYSETDKRHDDCAWYNTCLNKAAYMRLQSFTCVGCENYISSPDLKLEDFLVRLEIGAEHQPIPPGNMGNLKRKTKGLADKLRKKGIFMLGFRGIEH